MRWGFESFEVWSFRIEFKDMEGCRIGMMCYLCVLGDYVCVFEMISGICTVPCFEFNEEVLVYMLLVLVYRYDSSSSSLKKRDKII